VPRMCDPELHTLVSATARAVCASFVGLSLFGGIGAASGTFEQLNALVTLIDGLGPVERRVVARRLRRPERS